MKAESLAGLILPLLAALSWAACEPWTARYQGAQASGPRVIACWLVLPDDPLRDAGPNGLHLQLAGASIVSNGRFGPCLLSTDAAPDRAVRRAALAPANADSAARAAALSPWEDIEPDAAFLTIAPMHLRECFWVKIARPVAGIMYHGWQSLVPCPGVRGPYRLTHPETQHELRRLLREVLEPLGPALLQIPDAPAPSGMLESFTSQMFAGRGTYGWGQGWAGTAWHILTYAQLSPRILYEETIARDGLDGISVLALPDCDVLPRTIVDRIADFRRRGGLVIGDERLSPAVEADLRIPIVPRTGRASEEHAAMVEKGRRLAEALGSRHPARLRTSSPTVVPRLRQYGATDYVFAVNDLRQYGTYVGRHGLVMEDGVPQSAEVRLRRTGGHVYDLVAHLPVAAEERGGDLVFRHEFGPCEGTDLDGGRPADRVRTDRRAGRRAARRHRPPDDPRRGRRRHPRSGRRAAPGGGPRLRRTRGRMDWMARHAGR